MSKSLKASVVKATKKNTDGSDTPVKKEPVEIPSVPDSMFANNGANLNRGQLQSLIAIRDQIRNASWSNMSDADKKNYDEKVSKYLNRNFRNGNVKTEYYQPGTPEAKDKYIESLFKHTYVALGYDLGTRSAATGKNAFDPMSSDYFNKIRTDIAMMGGSKNDAQEFITKIVSFNNQMRGEKITPGEKQKAFQQILRTRYSDGADGVLKEYATSNLDGSLQSLGRKSYTENYMTRPSADHEVLLLQNLDKSVYDAAKYDLDVVNNVYKNNPSNLKTIYNSIRSLPTAEADAISTQFYLGLTGGDRPKIQQNILPSNVMRAAVMSNPAVKPTISGNAPLPTMSSGGN